MIEKNRKIFGRRRVLQTRNRDAINRKTALPKCLRHQKHWRRICRNNDRAIHNEQRARRTILARVAGRLKQAHRRDCFRLTPCRWRSNPVRDPFETIGKILGPALMEVKPKTFQIIA